MREAENILVLNAGSSSLRLAVFDELPARVLSGKFDRIIAEYAKEIWNAKPCPV